MTRPDGTGRVTGWDRESDRMGRGMTVRDEEGIRHS